MVISGAIPIDLQARERKRVWETKNVNGEVINVDDARKRSFYQEMPMLHIETRGRWTAKLLPDITRWMESKFGEVDYYLTQLFIWTRIFL